jgi:hypothetical protein
MTGSNANPPTRRFPYTLCRCADPPTRRRPDTLCRRPAQPDADTPTRSAAVAPIRSADAAGKSQ